MTAVACDLDGVLWRGREPIAGAAAGVAALRRAGHQVLFLTNNSSRPVAEVCEQLTAMDVPAQPEDVVSSAHAAAAVLGAELGPGSRVLVSGGPGIVEALEAIGLVPVANDGPLSAPVAAVVCGMDPAFSYDRLDRASSAVRDGARFVATNTDATFPGAGRLRPGVGSLVAAIATAAGREPVVAGKPAAATVELVRGRFGDTGIVVGDRPSTDGALAAALGWRFAMVLSGVGGHDPDEPVPEPPPDLLGADLGEIAARLTGYPAP